MANVIGIHILKEDARINNNADKVKMVTVCDICWISLTETIFFFLHLCKRSDKVKEPNNLANELVNKII